MAVNKKDLSELVNYLPLNYNHTGCQKTVNYLLKGSVILFLMTTPPY